MTVEKLFKSPQSTFGLAELERDEDGSVALTVDENLGARIFPLPPANDESGAPERFVVAVILGPIGMSPPFGCASRCCLSVAFRACFNRVVTFGGFVRKRHVRRMR